MAHEILVDLFKNRPSLTAEILVELLGFSLPAYIEARLASIDLTEIQPAEYRPMGPRQTCQRVLRGDLSSVSYTLSDNEYIEGEKHGSRHDFN